MVLCVAPEIRSSWHTRTQGPILPGTPLYRTLPIAPLRERFPDLHLVERSRNDLPAITSLKPASMFDLGLTTWDNVITRQLHDLSPQAVSDYVDAEDPLVYRINALIRPA